MPPAARILQANSGQIPVVDSPEPVAAESDVVVILAVLLCALICVVGLALVARCALLRRSLRGAGGGGDRSLPAPPNKGLKKKALKALPKISYGAAPEAGGRLSDCAICLAEFEEGDEIRILPQCGHGFHVACVDTWLGSHSSCPSCRRVLVVAPAPAAATAAPAVPQPLRCHRCGAGAGDTAAAAECGAKAREDSDPNRFLP